MKEDRPFDVLVEAKGKEVIVFLKNKEKYTGELISFDMHLNLVLSSAKEETAGEVGTVLVRGDALETIRGL